MKTRTITGLILIVLMFLVIFLAPVWAIPVFISLLSAIGVYEMLYTSGYIKTRRIVLYCMFVSILIPIWIFLGSAETGLVAILFFFVFLLSLEALTGTADYSFEKLAIAFFAGVVIPFFFSSLLRIYFMANGKFYLVAVFLATFSSDVFALLFGMKFGKTKLSPTISPNKTVEGSIGGLVMSPVILILFGLLLQKYFEFEVSFLRLALYGAAGAFSGQIGDLSMSYIKRQFRLKDFGNVFPGHGGILDRFDSVLFAAPFLELIILLFPAIFRGG